MFPQITTQIIVMSSIKRQHWNPLTLMLYVSIDFLLKKLNITQSRDDESKFFVKFYS